eukprot:TRINITY_DN3175_c0_g1_i1.p2 TRINITY_DN3175_c0_g1~~TRINITY_DN3175_c0_g1_i1.p2  ORF type:complete len:340 (-),score=62.82 TRINITY_DN3175_c0_g1_i1:1438-2457(-)
MKLSKLRVPELRKHLKSRGLDDKGNRPALIKRLREALVGEKSAKGVHGKQADLKVKHNEQQTTAVENTVASQTQQPASDQNGSAEARPSTDRNSKRKLEENTEPEDRSPKRKYRANSNGHNSSSASQMARKKSSPPRRQYRSKKVGDERAVHDKKQPDRTPPVQEQPSKRSEPAKQPALNSSTASQAGENVVKSLNKDSSGASGTKGQTRENGSSAKKVKSVPPKTACNLQKFDDAASLERIRRRKERFGIVLNEDAGGDPTDEEAVRRRRARFGIIAVLSNSSKIPNADKQEHDEAALRRRAEKFGMKGRKRGPTDAALPKDEAEKRLKRQKRFQGMS